MSTKWPPWPEWCGFSISTDQCQNPRCSDQGEFIDLPRYFTAESLAVFADELAALVDGKARFESEIPVVDIHGRPLLLELTLSVDPSALETWSRVLVSFVDVTERKKSEQQLRQQAMILDQISDAVTVTDLTESSPTSTGPPPRRSGAPRKNSSGVMSGFSVTTPSMAPARNRSSR